MCSDKVSHWWGSILDQLFNSQTLTPLWCAAPSTRKNVLFNDTLNTFYLRLYGVGHMVKDHSNSERGNPLPPHALLFLISSKGFYMHHPRQDNTYYGLCYTSCGALAGTRNSSMGAPSTRTTCTIMCCTSMCCTSICCTSMCCTSMSCTSMCCTSMCCTSMCCTSMSCTSMCCTSMCCTSMSCTSMCCTSMSCTSMCCSSMCCTSMSCTSMCCTSMCCTSTCCTSMSCTSMLYQYVLHQYVLYQ